MDRPDFPAALSLPRLEEFGQSDWIYFGLCALGFTLAGLITGYFIWRKSHMQSLDAEAEARRVGEDLAKLREDLEAEESGLRLP